MNTDIHDRVDLFYLGEMLMMSITFFTAEEHTERLESCRYIIKRYRAIHNEHIKHCARSLILRDREFIAFLRKHVLDVG